MQNLGGKIAKMAVYNVHFTAKGALKIDFVEDTVKLLAKTKTVDGINILSLEDIYLPLSPLISLPLGAIVAISVRHIRPP